MSGGARIPWSLGERIKHTLLPPRLYVRNKLWRTLRRGEPELRLLPFLVDPTRNAVDVGANKGVYAEALARLCPRVYAFEPNPKIFPILAGGCARNVEAFDLALSDGAGTAGFRVPRQKKGGYSNQGGTLAASKVKENYLEVEVRTDRLDTLGLSNVGFVKIDVEGHEQAVIAGAVGLIARDRPVLLVEIEEKYTQRRVEDDISDIRALGYEGLYLHAGVLAHLDSFDPESQHRAPQAPGDYVNNFIFLPID